MSNLKAIEEFIEKNEKNFDLNNIDPCLKKEIFEDCVRNLRESPSLLYAKSLRILSRDSDIRNEILEKNILPLIFSVARLDQYAHGDYDSTPIIDCKEEHQVETVKCLMNLVFATKFASINILKPLRCTEALLNRARVFSLDFISKDLMLFDFKLLFLITAFDSNEACKALTNYKALEAIKELLSYFVMHPNILCDSYDLICEACKISFNLLYACNENTLDDKSLLEINRLVSTMRDLIIQKPTNIDSYMEMLKNVVNFLTSIPTTSHVQMLCDKTSEDFAVPDHKSKSVMRAIFRIIKFFEYQHQHHFVEDKEFTSASVDENLNPVLAYFLAACKSSRIIKKYCRKKFLPPLKTEVLYLPEQGNSLRNRICQLMTANKITGAVSSTAATLIYVLCNSNIDRAIKYTGFGNLAGFLSNVGLMAGNKPKVDSSSAAHQEDDSSESSDSETEDYRKLQESINPMTGRWEPDFLKQQTDYLNSLTEEQKEFEVMQLVEKIDRLQREGFIKPATIGEDGSVKPVEHVLELLEHIPGDLRDKCHNTMKKDEDFISFESI